MSELDKTEREIESLGDTLASLEKVSFRSGIEFRGLFKEITNAANSINGAGKKWTIFSRLVSGTPLWKVQNYLRGALGVLSEFAEASKENTKARNEQNESIVKNIKQYDKLNQAMKDVNKVYEKFKDESGQGFLNDDEEKLLQEHIKDTAAYQIALKATGDEMYAMAKAMDGVREKHKQMRKEEEEVIRMAKESHAFDESRIELAKKRAEEVLKAQGFEGKELKKRVKKAGKDEKQKMSEEQGRLAKDKKKEGFENLRKSFFDSKQFKAIALPVAPLVGMFKLAKNRKKYQQKLLDFNNMMQKSILPNLQRMILFVIFGAIAFLLFVKAAYEIFKVLEEMGMITEIKEFLIGLFSVVMDIFSIAFAFISGDYEKAFELIPPMLTKIKDLLLEGGALLVALAWTTLTEGFGLIIDFFDAFVNDANFQAAVIDYVVQAGMLVAGVWMAKTLLAMALQLIATYAIPIAIFVLVSAFLVALYTRYQDEIKQMVEDIFGPPIDFLASLYDYITSGQFFSDILSTIKDFAKNFVFKVKILKGLKKFLGGIKDSAVGAAKSVTGYNRLNDEQKKFVDDTLNKQKALMTGNIKGAFADGGIVSASGLQLVGEKGPELVKLPAGSRVHSNAESVKMGDTNINITINAKDTSDAELRRIADQVGNMITNKINRSFSSSGFVR